MEVRPLMEKIPQNPEDIAKLKAAVASMPIYINALVSPDGKAAAVIADFRQDKTIPNFVAMLKDMREVVDRERDGTVDFYFGGTPVISRGGRPTLHEDADVFRLGAPGHHAHPVLVVPERSGNAAARRNRAP